MLPNSRGDYHRRGNSGSGGSYQRGRGFSASGDRGRGRGRGGSRGRGAAPIIDRASIPRGICQFYWSTGACNRNFDCTYRHEARVEASSSATQDYTPDFFSLEGLAVNNGSVLDTQHTLSPSQAHNHLRPYVFDNFVFRDAFHVEGFSRILASVNSRNRAWVRQTVTTSNIH